MSNNITVGFVFDKINTNTINNKLKLIIKYLSCGTMKYEKIKFCESLEEEKWIEIISNKYNNIEKLLYQLSQKNYGEISLYTNAFTNNNILVSVYVLKEKNFFAITIDVEEEKIIYSYESDVLSEVDDRVIFIMQELYEKLEYSYAFCDNEAELLFSPYDMKRLKSDIYSICIIPSDSRKINESNIYISSWYLNGLSKRNN